MEKFAQPMPKGSETVVAIARHPLHPMLVTFPIAFLVGALCSDLAFVALADPFWARASLWLIGAGTAMGMLAGLTGTVELLIIARIRRRAAAWSHFVVAVMLLAVSSSNWLMRMPSPQDRILPLGLALSLLTVALVVAAGWLGGKLVFEHHVGIKNSEQERDSAT
ncbi:MAG: DUF2231 domain-containing protein [Candidimonas sp.]